MSEFIYLDNSSTTFPKPKEVLDFAYEFYRTNGVNPSRATYNISHKAETVVLEARTMLMKFFNGDGKPERLVFSYNASDALNLIIQGMLKSGDHAITTTIEHNSVLRPLYILSQQREIKVDYITFDSRGYVDPDDIKKKIKKNTKLVIVNHGSNVLGTVQPVGEIGKICRERGVPFAIDTAQTAGVFPIDMERDYIDIVAFTGHKSLFAPAGIGGLYVRDGINIETTKFGGTGVKSAVRTHLEEYPFRLECGTLNTLGVAALHAGQKFIQKIGLDTIRNHEMKLLKMFINGLRNTEGITLYCPDSLEARVPVQSLNIDGYKADNVGTFLDVDYKIGIRAGLQCAPLTHETIGTMPEGAVRFSFGYFNTKAHIEHAINAVKELAELGKKRKHSCKFQFK